jgi:hypothetical protein
MINGAAYRQGQQPDSTVGAIYAVNGLVSVAAGKYGRCCLPGQSVLVAYDSSATPSCGDVWGPKSGQGTATANGNPGCLTVEGVTDSSNKIMLAQLVKASLHAVELKTTLKPSSDGSVTSATGWIVAIDPSTHTFIDPTYADTSNLITVYDPSASFYSLGHDASPGASGDGRGDIVWINDDNVVVAAEQLSQWIKGTVAAVDGSKFPTSITGCTTIDGGSMLTSDTVSSSTSPAIDANGFDTVTGSQATMMLDKVANTYVITDCDVIAHMVRGSNSQVSANATFTLTITYVLDSGVSPGSTISVTNYNCNLGASTDQTTCVRDDAGNWRVIDGPCSSAGACPQS